MINYRNRSFVMNLDWLHKVLATLFLVVGVAWWTAWAGWQDCSQQREIVVLQVMEWQVEEVWSDELSNEWKEFE